MSKAFKRMERGLKEAIAHARGKDAPEALGTVIHQIEVPDPDVWAIRARTGEAEVR